MKLSFGKKKFILIALLIFIIIAAVLFKGFLLETSIGLFIFALYMFGCFILGCIWWRCPHCKKALGRYIDSSRYCKHCGKDLYDNE